MADTTTLVDQHDELEQLMEAHREALVGLRFRAAMQRFAAWRALLERHLQAEDRWLLPALPAGARWASKVYEDEHRLLRELCEAHGERLQRARAEAPKTPAARRRLALGLIDAVHPLRHVLEHHHQREEQALLLEVPAQALVEAAREAAG